MLTEMAHTGVGDPRFEHSIREMKDKVKNDFAHIRCDLDEISKKPYISMYAAHRGRIQDQLTANDYVVLAAAHHASLNNLPLSFSAVQDLHWEMNRKVMNTQSIYNSFNRLEHNNLIESVAKSSPDRSVQSYAITRHGIIVLMISVLNEEIRNEALVAKQ